ncbi:Gfo/Idh/MocA family protein [Algoriphagus litoralis]|uniref:Gfo/Idh/MocA family protein n=1 Tax=Algoriphagus litoralis TaxID=2202829 RepID=UPI000DBA7B22|nr:Gfo/Idh/MocA family oxidoreductase [Algoriphagus litoralis]
MIKTTIGLVGCGIWGQKILRDLINIGAEVWAIDPDLAKLQKAKEMGALEVFHEIPFQNEPEGWVISTPAITHFEVLKSLFKTQKPIFVEKPLTCDYEEARQLAALQTAPTFVMHNWRYHAGIQMLSEIAKSSELGELVFYKSNRCNWTSPRSDVDSVWTLIPHDITIAYSVLGYFPEPKAAVVEEYDGIQRGMTAFLGKNPTCVLEVSNRYGDKRREVRLHFTKGVAVLKNEVVDYIEIYHGDDRSKPDEMKLELRKFEPVPPLRRELEIFHEFLRGGPEPKTRLEEGVRVIEIIDQLKKLAAQP